MRPEKFNLSVRASARIYMYVYTAVTPNYYPAEVVGVDRAGPVAAHEFHHFLIARGHARLCAMKD